MDALTKLFDPMNPPVFWAAISGTVAVLVAAGTFFTWISAKTSDRRARTPPGHEDPSGGDTSEVTDQTYAFVKDDEMTIQSGRFTANYHDAKWQLLTGKGDRPFERRIDFPKSFKEPPIVAVSLVGLDVDKGANLRVSVEAHETDRNGFTIYFKTWSDTKVYGLSAQWIAYGN